MHNYCLPPLPLVLWCTKGALYSSLSPAIASLRGGGEFAVSLCAHPCRQKEHPQRSLQVWGMDISKQIISAAAAHVCGKLRRFLPTLASAALRERFENRYLVQFSGQISTLTNACLCFAGIFIAILASGNGTGHVSQCAW